MAADEHQPQHVVAIVGRVDPFGGAVLGVRHVRDQRVVGRQRGFARGLAGAVERGIAADEDQPRRGSRGGPFAGHVFSARRHAS